MPSTLSNCQKWDSNTFFSFITKEYNRKITNDFSSKTMERVAFIIGWIISIPISIIKNIDYNVIAYAVLYKKSKWFIFST